MKKIVILLFVFSFTVLLRAQKQLSKSQQTVRQTVIKMFDALSDRDSVSLKLYCTDDIALYEYGLAWNIDTLITKAITLNTATDFKRINTIDFINTTVSKDVAWATYNLNSEITTEAKHVSIQWMETVVLVKEKKKWKIKVLHSALIKRN